MTEQQPHPYCTHCGHTLHPQAEKAVGSGQWAMVWADAEGIWVCARTGNEHEPEPEGPPQPHWHQGLIETAQSLVSEHGENPEYDRALVEFIIRLTPDASHDAHTEALRALIGVKG